MSNLRSQVKAYLESDSIITTTATGGIFGIPVGRETTPEVFDAFGTVTPCISIVVTDIAPIANTPYLDNTIVQIWIRTPETDDGEDASDVLALRARDVLSGWTYTTETGAGGEIRRQVGDTGTMQDPVIAHAKVRTLRFQAASVWRGPE